MSTPMVGDEEHALNSGHDVLRRYYKCEWYLSKSGCNQFYSLGEPVTYILDMGGQRQGILHSQWPILAAIITRSNELRLCGCGLSFL